MTDEQARALLATLESAYPKASGLSDWTRDLWVSAIGRHDYNRARRGLRRLVLENKWFPTLAEINQSIEAEGKGTTVVREEEAWPCEEDLVSAQEIKAAIAPLLSKLRGE